MALDTSSRLEEEMHRYARNLQQADLEGMLKAGINLYDVVLYHMVGAARMRVDGNLWVPDDRGPRGFITPVRVDQEPGELNPKNIEALYPRQANRSGEIIDLVAWHPARPGRWALREGAAEVLGNVEYRALAPGGKEPLKLHLDPLEWLRSRGEGVVILNREPQERQNIKRGLELIGFEVIPEHVQLPSQSERPAVVQTAPARQLRAAL